MKKKLLILLTAVILFVQMPLVSQDTAAASEAAFMELDGKLANGRVFVPVRALGESLGAKVRWDSKEKMVLITFGETEFSMRPYELDIGTNGILTGLALDEPMVIHNNLTYVPISFLAKTIGATVKWNNQIKQASVSFQGLKLIVNAKYEPAIKLPKAPTEQRIAELYAKVQEAVNITNYAQKRQHLAGYFTNELINRVIRNNGLTQYDKDYAGQFPEPTLLYEPNSSRYYAGLYQSFYVEEEPGYYSLLSRTIVLKFVDGKWLVYDVDTSTVEPRY